jgi:hypothetical protein
MGVVLHPPSLLRSDAGKPVHEALALATLLVESAAVTSI